MTEIEIKKNETDAEVFMHGEKLGTLSPQEIWDLSEELRDFAIANASDFSAKAHSEIEVNDRSFSVLPLPHHGFWNQVNNGEWEPETYAIFDRFLNSKSVFLDIGAWIGSTALYGAQIASETHAFEPDPVSFAELEANFQANKNEPWFSSMKIHRKAVAVKTGKLKIGSKNSGGDSMSSVLFQSEGQSWQVDSVDLNTLIDRRNLSGKPLFLKIDIEGGEYNLIPTLKEFFKTQNTALCLALHPEFLLESLRKQTKGFLKELRVRWAFYKMQSKVIYALPFAHLEHANGRIFKYKKYLLKALITGSFPHTLVAYN